MTKRLITEFFGATRDSAKKRAHNLIAADAGSAAASDTAPSTSEADPTTTLSDEGLSSVQPSSVVPLVKGFLGSEWGSHLEDELRKPYFEQLWSKVAKDRATKKVYPPEHLVFNAFKLVPYVLSTVC
ncbi:uracil-DNA glycosylase family protein [Babesia divergens]|uniref:Uracil-DNA glycosylase family protein n=1 Tax=Babesia divergens TaxID=32595 RepID=A0AAD9G7B7_BABDI|nr:uracil-DNA glycosylase family protein [Babesia divergens]